MNIQTVAQNLRNTIAGKENHLAVLQEQSQNVATYATIKFLEANLEELYNILADVEQCVAKDVEQSWRDNPDRMGGQFTQDEIDNAEKW